MGNSYLKKGGYIHYPSSGNVQITEKGLSLNSNLTLQDLEEETSLLDFYKTEHQKHSHTTEIIQISNASPQDLTDEGFDQIEKEIKNDLLEKLKKSGDGGIDGIINEDKLGLDKIYIQAKRFTENKVREKDIRNFIGAMSGDTNKGVIVTTSLFDKGQ